MLREVHGKTSPSRGAREIRNEEKNTAKIKGKNFSSGSKTSGSRWPVAVSRHEQMKGQTRPSLEP
jgi:hypothetical protein